MEMTMEKIQYEPEWNADHQLFEDICPFEKNKSGNEHVCCCRHNVSDIFKNKSQFDAHVKKEHHKIWMKNFGKFANEEILRLRSENKDLAKRVAILRTQSDKYKSQSTRHKLKYDKLITERIGSIHACD